MRQFTMPKSQSCPNLFMDEDDEEEEKIIPNIKGRERAFSECIKSRQRRHRSISSMTLNRSHSVYKSDSDLSHIDKEKTFAFALDQRRGTVQPGELLAKVVVALGGFRLGENDEPRRQSVYGSSLGIHGFTDSQILASERNNDSDWSIATSEKSCATPKNLNVRSRTASEIRIPIDDSNKVTNLMLHLIALQFPSPFTHHSCKNPIISISGFDWMDMVGI